MSANGSAAAAGSDPHQPSQRGRGRLRLGQYLLERGWISGEQLLRAVQSQRSVGGRIGTCLLEMDAISEDRLLDALANQLGVPAVRIEQMRGIEIDTLSLVPAKLAVKYGAIPFEASPKELMVAALDVNDLARLDALAFAADKKIRAHIANEARLYEALERYYGFECPQRYGHLLDRLNRARYLWNDQTAEIKREDVVESVDEWPVDQASQVRFVRPDDVFVALSTPHQKRSMSALGLEAKRASESDEAANLKSVAQSNADPNGEDPAPGGDDLASVAKPAGTEPATPDEPTAAAEHTEETEEVVTALLDDTVPPLARPRSLAEVGDELASQRDVEQIADVLLEFLAGPFLRCLLLRKANHGIEGWRGFGPGFDADRLRACLIPVEDWPALRGTSAGPQSVLYGNLEGEHGHTITRCWGDASAEDWWQLEVRLKGRLVCIILGHRASRPVPEKLVAQFAEVSEKTALAFEMCILGKKIRRSAPATVSDLTPSTGDH